MPRAKTQSPEQQDAEAQVERFRSSLGPFVVAAETTRMAMAFTDARERDHPIIFANDSFLALTGYQRSDVLGRAFMSLVTEGLDPAALVQLEAELEGGSNKDPEIHVRRKDGSEFWASLFISPVLDERGEVVQHFISLIDLTSYKLSERALKEAVRRFQIVTRVTDDVVWDWDMLEDKIWCSEGIQALFGYAGGANAGGISSWTARIDPDDRERVLEGMRVVIQGIGEKWSDEYRLRRADGSCAQVMDRGFVIRDARAKAIRVVGSMADVTRQRELEAQLRQSQRLDAIGQLTGGVAHDFNNLLTVVLGNAEALEARLSDNPSLRQLAEMTRIAAERGGELTRRLLAFSRRQALEPNPTDVNALISGMGALLGRALGEHVETRIWAESDLWPALIDAPQLESAVLNLCINARDAMPNGGQITIQIANMELDRVETPEMDAAPGQFVMVAVSDTGTGMSEETLAHAFEPFFTTKEVGKGSGLGLSMVHGFVEQSKGQVRIESELGKGSSVKLYLPRAVRAKDSIANPSTLSAAMGGSETILVAEDDELVRAQIAAELGRLGYQVVSVENGVKALEALRSTTDFDLLLTDVVMPGGMNGRQLANEALKLRPNLPVLFTTGYAEAVIVHEGRLDPGINLLQKPYHAKDLAAKVRAALSQGTEASRAGG